MSYSAHTWVDGETITAAKLNNIEDGIDEASQTGGGGLAFVTWTHTNDGITLGMTAQQIFDGMLAGGMYAVNINVTESDGYRLQKGLHVIYDIDDRTADEAGITLISYSYQFWASSYSDYPSAYLGD